jgi:hypothetical protein
MMEPLDLSRFPAEIDPVERGIMAAGPQSHHGDRIDSCPVVGRA